MVSIGLYYNIAPKSLFYFLSLVAEWIHFTLLGRILPTMKLKVYTFWGL